MREYVKRFNKVVLEIDEADEQVIIMTFQARLNNLDLVFSLGKTHLTSMMSLLFKAQNDRHTKERRRRRVPKQEEA